MYVSNLFSFRGISGKASNIEMSASKRIIPISVQDVCNCFMISVTASSHRKGSKCRVSLSFQFICLAS